MSPADYCDRVASLAPDRLPKDVIRDYWDHRFHDAVITARPLGTPEFFQELDEYRFEKLCYLPRLVEFASYRGDKVLEVGCGLGIDLMRFAQAGAIVTGIDLAPNAIDLARRYFALRRLPADLRVMDGEALQFDDNSFDVVYAHGVLQYTVDARTMVQEIHRVLRPGGEACLMVYNKYSWLNALSKLARVELEHQDAPVLRKYTIPEFRSLLRPFAHASIIPERFPVATRLHQGWKAALYNNVFVNISNWLPRSLVRPLGWHLLAIAFK